MKTIKKFSFALLILTVALASCNKEDSDDNSDNTPTSMQADNNWFEDEIAANEVKWYKITGEETFNTMYIEWAEFDNHGQDRDYSANIVVSAYQLDGETGYFEAKDNGYKDKKKSIDLGIEKQVLVKVEIGDENLAGTFALRSTGTGVMELEYTELELEADWTEMSIEEGETLGFSVDYTTQQAITVIWAEVDSPETSYTANVMGSVFKKDGETPYKQLGRDDDFLNKNKSHSTDPKAVEVDLEENKIKIHITEAGSAGTFAIKVREHFE